MFQNSTLPSVSVDITRNITSVLPRLSGWSGLSSADRLPLPRSFREYLVWLVVLVGVTGLALLQVSVTLQISQAEANVAALRSQYLLYEQANAQLLWEISHFTTLERIETEAVAAGFVPALQRRYVTPELTVAALPATPSAEVTRKRLDEPSLWSAQIESGNFGPVDRIGSLWESWSGQWVAWTQAVKERVDALSKAVTRQWLKIDLSNYLWIGSSRR